VKFKKRKVLLHIIQRVDEMRKKKDNAVEIKYKNSYSLFKKIYDIIQNAIK